MAGISNSKEKRARPRAPQDDGSCDGGVMEGVADTIHDPCGFCRVSAGSRASGISTLPAVLRSLDRRSVDQVRILHRVGRAPAEACPRAGRTTVLELMHRVVAREYLGSSITRSFLRLHPVRLSGELCVSPPCGCGPLCSFGDLERGGKCSPRDPRLLIYFGCALYSVAMPRMKDYS